MRRNNCGLVVLLVALFTFDAALATPLSENQLVGARKCTWGPSYWCHNLSNAKDCKAVSHCIQTVWERQVVPEDNDSICQICKDMVKQARDQLRSNETMEELKEVFEGSCNLIPIKLVKKECCKLADDFVPELVEALSSQMNPDQVCSVAGLCNNAEIDKMLTNAYTKALEGTLEEEDSSEEEQTKLKAVPKFTCSTCNHVSSFMVEKFTSVNRDEVLEKILYLCGQMSSFSDACANIALTYFNEIYDNLRKNIEAPGICHVSGVCSYKYHQHAEDTVAADEDIAALATLDGDDDIPCELCKQLVQHLRDVLIANTTETEFKQVLEGLCKQSKGFKDECLSIVDQYYDVIYQTLTKELDASGACFLIGVCPKGKKSMFEGEIRPLLPSFPPAEIKVTIRKKLGANEPKFTAEELHAMTLPIDTLMGATNPGILVEDGKLCTICEYILHFIQESLATPATEDEIKDAVSKICDKGPQSIRGQCHNFIDMYGDAVIALLIQGLNPREVCPKMQMCPQNHEFDSDMEVFSPIAIDDFEDNKPTCPLCLFAVEQAQEKIKNDKTKQNIKNVLDHLCVRLPQKLRSECEDFVNTYSSELVDMLITDFKPQEICVALKLCEKENTSLEDMAITLENSNESSEESYMLNEIETNDGMPVKILFGQAEDSTPNCLLCVELVKIVEKRMKKHTTKEEIKRALEQSCAKLKKTLQHKCHSIVEKYGDKIAELLLKEMNPKMICTELGMCLFSEKEDLEIDEALKYDVFIVPNANVQIVSSDRITMQDPPNCVLCEFVMTKLEAELKNKKTQEEIKAIVEKICTIMPKTVKKECDSFIQQYANAMLALIGSIPPKQMCQYMLLCPKAQGESLDTFVTDEIAECGVCHGAAASLLPFFKQYLDHDSIGNQNMIDAACESVPAKYYQSCSDMISIYGQSMLLLSQKEDITEDNICAKIGKCLKNEESALAFARISA